MYSKITAIICLCILPLVAHSQQKMLQAIRISEKPKIDGKLDDKIWQNAPVATDFIQESPDVGKPATKDTEVKIVYDDDAIYIAARLYDDPALIRKQLTARDDEQSKDIDYFSVLLDTYHDKQNAFQFLVSAANVQSDSRLSSNTSGEGGFGSSGDKTWDAVWQSEVLMQQDGWTVEIRIPYISLRFAKKQLQDWGLQFSRLMRRNNERTYWNEVKPSVNGIVNQFGIYSGLENLQPPLRLSFSPYLSTGYRSSPDVGNTYKHTWLRSGGVDVKYGINESFTLDATLIPDFGQVVSDNVVNNLTPYEVQFEENRQFFTEGTELFNKAGLFYSRRIGAQPEGYYEAERFAEDNADWKLVRNPALSQLYNATKISGRNSHKTGIGVVNAVTAPVYATLKHSISQQDTSILTAPLTNYNIFVLDQALKGRSSVTLTNTNVMRNGSAADANLTAFDFSLFDSSNRYNISGTARYSKTFSAVNPEEGFNTGLHLGKVGGQWEYFLEGNAESESYNPNHLGYLDAPNEMSGEAGISYSWYTPGKTFQTFVYSLTSEYNRLYKPSAYTNFSAELSGFWLFRNFWDVTLDLGYVAKEHDYFVLGDPAEYNRFVQRPGFTYFEISGSTDSRRRLFVVYEFTTGSYINSSLPKYHYEVYSGVRYRFSDRFSLDLSYSYETESNYIINAGRDLNDDPVVALVDYREASSILSATYNFTPRLNLTVRTRHYLSRVKFDQFANVTSDGLLTDREGSANYENVNVFNTDAFLTWDFRLGSRLIAGYKNWLGPDEKVDLHNDANTYLNNYRHVFGARHGNEVSVRFIYFLDYNQLRKQGSRH